MAAVNDVACDTPCPKCGERIPRTQFRYGELRVYHYKIGDQIIFGGVSDVGRSRTEPVIVDGFAVCARCGAEVFFDILVKNDTIISVDVSDRAEDMIDGFIVPSEPSG
jgi:hypothetical protein